MYNDFFVVENVVNWVVFVVFFFEFMGSMFFDNVFVVVIEYWFGEVYLLVLYWVDEIVKFDWVRVFLGLRYVMVVDFCDVVELFVCCGVLIVEIMLRSV